MCTLLAFFIGVLLTDLLGTLSWRQKTEQEFLQLRASVSSTEKWIEGQPITVNVPEGEDTENEEAWGPVVIRIPVKGATIQNSQCFLSCMADYDSPQKPYCMDSCKDSPELYEEFSQGRAVQLMIDSLGLKYLEGTERTITTPEKLMR